jgi:hypothetical protein
MGLRNYERFFTVGQSVGSPGFEIPTRDIEWQPIFPPVVLDLWPAHIDESCRRISTIADWRGSQYARFEDELYAGKRDEFVRFIELPRKIRQPIELALTIGQHDHEDLGRLLEHDWLVRDPYLYAGNLDSYREFIRFSRAELSVAKSGYVKSHSGWFSDRTACYLASGKPAVVQSTGFEPRLPAGEGLFTFTTEQEAVDAIEAIERDYRAHAEAARQIAEERLDARVVLGPVLDQLS